MKKNKFSFLDWLTKKDIEKILKLNSMKLAKDLPLYMQRATNEEGEKVIYLKCEKMDNTENEIINKISASIFGPLCDIYSNNYMLIAIYDYAMTECFSIRPEDEQLEISKQMTNNYQGFMQEKFGTFYNSKKSAYIKKLKKELKEETKNQEKENNNEM